MNQFPNLLIVDDDKGSILLLKLILRKISVNVINAYSGQEALEKTKGVDLALAIFDVQMPTMNGYELAVQLNKERSAVKVPVIFLSATFPDNSAILQGYNSGAVDYLLKPVEPGILISKINVFLELHNQRLTIQRESAVLKNYANELTRVNLALKESEEKYRSYIDNAPDGVFVVNREGRYLDVNNAACRITGYSKEELLAKSIPDILPEESVEETLRGFHNLIRNGKVQTDLLFLHKNHEKRWMSLNSVEVKDSLYIGFAKDVTLRKEMEDFVLEQQVKLEKQNLELTKSKELAEKASRKYTELYDSAPSCYFTLSADNTILELNFSAACFLGKKRSELIGTNFGNYISRTSIPAFEEFLMNIFRKKIKKTSELLVDTSGNGQRYVHAEGTIIIEGFQCQVNLIDITERKIAEQTLMISEEKYRTIFDNAGDAIAIHDLEGNFIDVNEIICRRLGYSREELLKVKVGDVDARIMPVMWGLVFKNLQKRVILFLKPSTLLGMAAIFHRKSMQLFFILAKSPL